MKIDRTLFNIIHKNKLKMDQRLKCNVGHIKLLEKNRGTTHYDVNHSSIVLIHLLE